MPEFRYLLVSARCAHSRTAIQLHHRSFLGASAGCWVGPTRSAHANMLPSSPVHESTLFPHLERQGGNRPSWKCTAVLYTLAQTPQLERQGGESPLLKVHRGVIHPRTNSAARMAGGRTPTLDAPARLAPQATLALAVTRASAPRTPTRTLAHVPRHRAPHTYVIICITSLPLPPSISGPMANREVKWAAQVAVCENALRRQQQLGPLFFPLSAAQHGKYPKCSLALIPSQARGGDHYSLMLPSVPHSLSPHRYLC